jgi:hypothetical protein
MPGGARIKTAWVDGKPPRYWTVFGIALLLFVCLWVFAALNIRRFGRPTPGSFHSVAMLEGGSIRFYPAILFRLATRGLVIVMVWTFVLGVVMAFKRKIVP